MKKPVSTRPTDFEKATHPQADTLAPLRTIPMPEGDACYEHFGDFLAVYTRVPHDPYWTVGFYRPLDMKRIYGFGEEKDQFTGQRYLDLMQLRLDAQRWVADVRRLVKGGRARRIEVLQ